MLFYNLFLVIFVFNSKMCFGGEQSKFIVESDCQPTIQLKRNGDCESLILCYKSALLSSENLAWKVAGRFRFNSFLSNQKKKCGKGERKIQISLKGEKLSIGKECFNISRNATKITIHLNSKKSMFAHLKIDQVEKTLFKFGIEFFDQTSFGPFLEDYAGLWLLGLDMFPKFAQNPMQISVQKSNKCGLMQNILCKNFQPVPNASEQNAAACKCSTFNGTETKHGSHSSNPLILGGKQIDIKTVPWAVRFLGLTNQTGNSSFYTLCGGSLISFEFVLLAAHCFDNVKNGNKFYIGYNSSSAVDFNNNNNGAVNEKHLRHNEINVFIHPKYHTHQTQHDLALIKLNHPVKVLPTCLYCGAAEEFRKGTAFVTGWGQMTDDCKGKTAMAKRLMGRYVQLMECPLKEFVICVEPDTVQTGDSGSALLASNGTHFVQVAVLSSGICNDQTNTSRVNYFSPLDKEWIEKISGVYCPN